MPLPSTYPQGNGRSAAESPQVSIIVCTRNRADHLQGMLASLADVYVPRDWWVELIVVDNASSDNTREVIREAELSDLDLHILNEQRPGTSYAKNTGVSAAKGDVLLFTDDDVRLPPEWIIEMTNPIRKGDADALAGGVALAPHLIRSWQLEDPWITSPLATTHAISDENPHRMVGANMAVASYVIDRVPPFDTNLDPGTPIGLGAETLWSLQIQDAGFTIGAKFDTVVQHYCSSDRLSRERYLDYALKIGRSQGYIDYHWKQANVSPFSLLVEIILDYAKLLVGRILRRKEVTRPEGLPGWEMSLLTQIYHRQQLLRERGHIRKYEWLNSLNGNVYAHG